MKRKIFTLLIVAVLFPIILGEGVLAAPPQPPPTLTTLEPGGFQSIEQNLDINVVFIGFGGYTVDTSAFETALPQTYQVINRYPSFYGNREFLGNNFTFNYNLLFPDEDFEDSFFGWLGDQGFEDDSTSFQDLYNAEDNNMLDVIAPVRYIDGPSVESWLEANGTSLMGDYTVFFINWYGRGDFQYHVYTKTDQPDPDTGFNFGTELDSHKMIAWGGSYDRSWFYDFSAGPEGWSNNWAIDEAPGYTIPPIWEYGNPNAYRPFDDLTGDMAKITRYIAINLLFTPSPLYKPLLSPPNLPSRIDLDVNMFEAEPGFSGLDMIDPDHIEEQFSLFQPYKTYTVDLDDYQLKARHDAVFDCWAADEGSCYGNRLFNIAFADLYLYANDNLLRYLDGDTEYEIPIFAYNTTPEKIGVNGGLLGYADDDWSTGTQSYVFEFGNSVYRSFGYGFSVTTVHEVGHHIGLSHPFDGYDYEQDFEYGPGGDFYFVWSGDESDTVMSYMSLSWGFGIFNQDSMYRYETAGYINQANSILANIYTHPRVGMVSALILSADSHALTALESYQDMNYLSAVEHAQLAYADILTAADELNIPVKPQSWQSDYKALGKKFHVDPIRYPDI